MDKKLPLLQIRMFGKERITYGENQNLFGRNALTKAMKLMLILTYYGKKGISRNRLLEELYGREELANVGNNLRVTIHRLKKFLVDEGLPEYEYIRSEQGVYYWDCPMEMEIDVHRFEELIEMSQSTPDPSKKCAYLKEACSLYKGEFLQKLSGEEWVLMESVRLKKLYTAALDWLVEYLMGKRDYETVLHIVTPACELYPFDEWQSVKIDCYVGMNRYADALKEYEDTAKILVEELGVVPSEHMMQQFKEMSTHITSRPQIISEIKGGLKEEEWEKGAFFCTVPGFRDAYRVTCRAMERNGQSVFLLLCTLVDNNGRPMEHSDKLVQMSEALFHAIKDSLRRCDSFTKYNHAQYLVMLMGTNEENCQVVIDRITRAYALEHKTWAQHLECSVTSLMEI